MDRAKAVRPCDERGATSTPSPRMARDGRRRAHRSQRGGAARPA